MFLVEAAASRAAIRITFGEGNEFSCINANAARTREEEGEISSSQQLLLLLLVEGIAVDVEVESTTTHSAFLVFRTRGDIRGLVLPDVPDEPDESDEPNEPRRWVLVDIVTTELLVPCSECDKPWFGTLAS